MMQSSHQFSHFQSEKFMSGPCTLESKFVDINQALKLNLKRKRKNTEPLKRKNAKRSRLTLPKTPRDPINGPLSVEEVYPYGIIDVFSDDEDENAEVLEIFKDFPKSPLPSTPEHRPLTPRDFLKLDRENKNHEPVPKLKILKMRDFSAQTNFFSEHENYYYGIHSKPECYSRLNDHCPKTSSGSQTSEHDFSLSSSFEQDPCVESSQHTIQKDVCLTMKQNSSDIKNPNRNSVKSLETNKQDVDVAVKENTDSKIETQTPAEGAKPGHQASSVTLVAQTSKYAQRRAHKEAGEILALRHEVLHLEPKNQTKQSQPNLSKSKEVSLKHKKIASAKQAISKKPVLSKLDKLKRKFSRGLFKR